LKDEESARATKQGQALIEARFLTCSCCGKERFLEPPDASIPEGDALRKWTCSHNGGSYNACAAPDEIADEAANGCISAQSVMAVRKQAELAQLRAALTKAHQASVRRRDVNPYGADPLYPRGFFDWMKSREAAEVMDAFDQVAPALTELLQAKNNFQIIPQPPEEGVLKICSTNRAADQLVDLKTPIAYRWDDYGGWLYGEIKLRYAKEARSRELDEACPANFAVLFDGSAEPDDVSLNLFNYGFGPDAKDHSWVMLQMV